MSITKSQVANEFNMGKVGRSEPAFVECSVANVNQTCNAYALKRIAKVALRSTGDIAHMVGFACDSEVSHVI